MQFAALPWKINLIIEPGLNECHNHCWGTWDSMILSMGGSFLQQEKDQSQTAFVLTICTPEVLEKKWDLSPDWGACIQSTPRRICIGWAWNWKAEFDESIQSWNVVSGKGPTRIIQSNFWTPRQSHPVLGMLCKLSWSSPGAVPIPWGAWAVPASSGGRTLP